MVEIFGIELVPSSLALGAITGMTYGILAVGLVLIYRSNRIINFAHGEIGAFAAAVFGGLVTQGELHYWLAFPLAIGLGAALGAGAEFGVVRRLKNAPKLMSAVATLALGQLLVFLTLVVNIGISAGGNYPLPRWFPRFRIGGLLVHEAYFGMLVITPALVIALALFLRYSRYGLGIRASAANPEAAQLSGVFSSRMSSLSWAIAGGVSAFTAIMLFPSLSFVSSEILGPSLLLRALTAAVIARMHSLPVALVAGLGLGLVEQTILWNYPRGGLTSMTMFVIILGALLLQRSVGGREEDKSSWAAVQPWPPLRETIAQIPAVANMGRNIAVVALGVALLLPVVATNALSVHFTAILAFALIGLSLGVATGLGGQLSLGQFAIAGVGATVSWLVSQNTGGAFVIALPAAGIAGAGVSMIIGIPAMRIRGLMLTVTTLGFALAAQDWLFKQDWMLGSGVDPGAPIFLGRELDTGKRYYYFAVVVAAVGIWLARNVWVGGLSRRLRAVRDNEDAARAFAIPATRVKVEGFLIAGFLAGLGGAVYGHALSEISSAVFLIVGSVDVAIIAVLGGVGMLAGPILGAIWVIGVPLLPLDNAGLAASALGILLLIMYFPAGIAGLIRPLRDRVVSALARRAGVDISVTDDTELEGSRIELPTLEPIGNARDGELLLDVKEVVRHFGGIRAVDGVSLQVRAGETVGLIGPNGAGKTTLFEVIGGFTPAQSGSVVFRDEDVTRLPAEARARRGLIRSFQDAALFPTLTTLEVVKLSLERTDPTKFFPALAGTRTAELAKDKSAREFVGAMGLHDFRNKQVRELSTGTRRITELACLVALEPTLLLLDEPTSGIAQREVEALGSLLERMKRELKLTLLIIEHDIPMVMSISDRVVAMDTGRTIADGTPDQVRLDPAVIESYLGGDVTTIERSGAQSAALGDAQSGAVAVDDGPRPEQSSRWSEKPRCVAVTRTGIQCTRRATISGYCTQHSHLAEVHR